MAKIVIACAILLGALGTVQIVSMERSRKPDPPSRMLLPFGSGFSGSPTLPQEDLEAVRREAEKTMKALNESGVTFKRLAEYTGLGSFIVTTILTLIAGTLGVAMRDVPPGAMGDVAIAHLQKTHSKSRRVVTIIGFISALGAALSLSETRLRSYSEDLFKRSDELLTAADETRSAIDAAVKEDDARKHLNDFHIKIRRLQ